MCRVKGECGRIHLEVLIWQLDKRMNLGTEYWQPVLKIVFHLFSVRTAIDIDFVDASVGEELQCVFNQRDIGEWEEALDGE